KMRLEARKQAAIDVARIEAEAKARLEADSARRAHELEILRARGSGRNRRLQHALAAVLSLVVSGGAVAACATARQIARLEQEAGRLRNDQLAIRQAHERVLATELAALDRRHTALRAHPFARDAEDAAAAAEVARNAINTAGADDDRIRAFEGALD